MPVSGRYSGNPRPKKSLGQVFLVDAEIAREIIAKAGFSKGDRVLEIGPGRGILTAYLVKGGVDTVCCEIDSRLTKALNKRFGERENFRLIEGDILALDLDTVFPDEEFQALGNLPYHLTSEILFKFFDYVKKCWDGNSAPRAKSLTVMVQKEVGERLLSKPGCRLWGVLSLYTELFGEIESLLEAPSGHFKPQPKVDSTVVKIRFRGGYPFEINDYELFRRLIKAAFGNRRKMLRNSLAGFSFPVNLEMDLRLRPEELRAEDFAYLANSINEGNDTT